MTTLRCWYVVCDHCGEISTTPSFVSSGTLFWTAALAATVLELVAWCLLDRRPRRKRRRR